MFGHSKGFKKIISAQVKPVHVFVTKEMAKYAQKTPKSHR